VQLNKIAENARDALCKKCRKLFKAQFGPDVTNVPANWRDSPKWVGADGVWKKLRLELDMMPSMVQISNMLEKKRGKASDRWKKSPAAAQDGGDGQYRLFPSPRKRSPKNKGDERRKKRKSAAPVQIPVVISEGQRGAPAGEAAGGQVPPQGDAAN